MNQKEIFEQVQNYLEEQGYVYDSKDDTRPWGGFYTIHEKDASRFAAQYFSWSTIGEKKISPKFLIVKPNTRLSWQYHHRRSELWKLIKGEAFIVRSMSDDERPAERMQTGEIIRLEKGERHRLVGGNDWGIVAEIWVHTDELNPSDENDIVRLSDDFGRSGV